MSRVEYAPKPVPVFTKLAILLRNIPAMQFVLTKLAALLGRNKTQTLPLDSKFLGESPEVTENSDKSTDSKTAIVEPSDGDASAVPPAGDPSEPESFGIPPTAELLDETSEVTASRDESVDQQTATMEPSDVDAGAASLATDQCDGESLAVAPDTESLGETSEVTGSFDESVEQQSTIVVRSDVDVGAAPLASDQSDGESLTVPPDIELLGETPEVAGSLDESTAQQTAMVEPSDVGVGTAPLATDQFELESLTIPPEIELLDVTGEVTGNLESAARQIAVVAPSDSDAIAARREEDRESLIRRRWAETGIKMWNPDVHGAGLAALGIQGRVGLLQPESGGTLPRYDRLEFKLIDGHITCEAVVVDPPKSRRRSLTP